MNAKKTFLTAALLMAFSAGVSHADTQQTSSMLCAITDTLTCDKGACVRGPATAVNLPVFINIDTETQTIQSARQAGDYRSSKIASMGTHEDTLVLLGRDLGVGWSATIDKASGSLTGTIVDQGIGYIVFGSCLPH